MRTFYLNLPWGTTLPEATYDKKLKHHIYRGEALPSHLQDYASPDYSWLRWQEDSYNRKIAPVTPSPVTFSPRAHQKAAAIKIAQAATKGLRGFVVGDTTGLGKTISCAFGIYGAMKMRKQRTAKVLVVCPKSVIEHWSNTIKSLHLTGVRVVIINYEQSKKLLSVPATAAKAKKASTRNKHQAASGKSRVDWDYIIADESHKMKNDSQQTAAFRNIARYTDAAEHAPFVIWSSATIGQNPLDVAYLSPLLYQLTKTPLKTSWGDWCISQGLHVETSRGGSLTWLPLDEHSSSFEKARVEKLRTQDLTKLNSIIFSPQSPSVRRRASDIAGWPEISRYALGSTLTPAELEEYQQQWLIFRRGHNLALKGKNPQGALVQQLRFRQKSSMIRAAATVDHILDFCDNGYQVCVSVEFLETADVIKKALLAKGIKVAEYTGRNESVREKERIIFQRGQAQVMIFSVQEAVSFHASETLPDNTLGSKTPRVTLAHDVRYSALSMLQIEGRTHRDGQNASIYYLFAYHTVEDKIIQRMLTRMKHVTTLMDDATLANELDAILAD